MSQDENREQAQQDPKASGDAGDHEVNPAQNPGPRGNPERDPERVGRDEEDLDRMSGD